MLLSNISQAYNIMSLDCLDPVKNNEWLRALKKLNRGTSITIYHNVHNVSATFISTQT